MLSAHEKLQIAAWKAETKAAQKRVHGEDAPEWVRHAAYFFFFTQKDLLAKAEKEGRLIDAQIAHCQTLRAFGEVERVAVLEKSIDAYFASVRAA
jgi:hypothetical protein